MSNNYDKLIGKAVKAGIDIDKVVYSINVADIIQEISGLLEDNAELNEDELIDLIGIGECGSEYIAWSEPIVQSIIDSKEFRNIINKGD